MALECTCSALRMAARRLTQAYDAALAPTGLTTSQFALLAGLDRWRGPPPTVSELADHLALDRTTLAHNLHPLRRDRLVDVSRDGGDGRVKRVVLTDLGRARHQSAYPLWRRAQDRFDRNYGADRSGSLRAALLDIAHGPAADLLEHSHVG